MDFRNKVIFVWNILGEEVWVTQTVFNTWIIMTFLTILSIIINVKLKSFTDKPKRFQNIVEIVVESMDNFVKTTMSEKYSYFGNWFFGVFVMIWCFNLSGLVALRPPTTSLATTAAFALVSFALIQFMAIKTGKLNYLKEFFEPFPVMLPINIIGELATPVSLSFRLFGNILGGYIILAMIYGLFPIFLKIGIPSFLHIYFDVFSGSLQAFVFTILSMTFLKNKIAEE